MLEQSINLLEFNIQQAELILSKLKINISDDAKDSLTVELAHIKDSIAENIIVSNVDYDDYLSDSNASYLTHRAEMVIDYAELIVDEITQYFDNNKSRTTRYVKKPKAHKVALVSAVVAVPLLIGLATLHKK